MKKLIALLLAMVLVVGLCACGKKGEKKTPADQAQDIVNDALVVDVTGSVAGRYYLVSMSEDGETITVEEYCEMFGVEYERYIDLYNDGTAFMHTAEDDYSEGIDLVWSNGKMWPVGEPDDYANLTISGNTLTLSQDGMTMTFKKG